MTTVEIVTKWLNDSKDEIIKNYDRDNMRASGSFARGLRVDVEATNAGIKGTLFGSHHSLFVDQGRGKTSSASAASPPLRDMIRQWIDDKGITPKDNISKDSLSFLITRKIHREGWMPKNKYPNGVISSVINKTNIDKLILNLTNQLAVKIKTDTWQQFA